MTDRALQERSEVFAAVFVLAQLLARSGDSVLEPLGVTTRQWLLLAVLTRRFAGREPTLTEVAGVYGSSRQNVKQIALQLEKAGYLRLTRDPRDARVVRLKVLPAIAAFDAPVHRARQESFLDEVFAKLPASDVRELHRIVTRWLASLSPA